MMVQNVQGERKQGKYLHHSRSIIVLKCQANRVVLLHIDLKRLQLAKNIFRNVRSLQVFEPEDERILYIRTAFKSIYYLFFL